MKSPEGIILSCSGYELTSEEKDYFKKIYPFGFVLFKRNFKDKKQLLDLINHLKSISLNPKTLIFIDQEGGKVQRLGNEEYTIFPPQRIFGQLYQTNKVLALDLAYKSAYLMGIELKNSNIDVDFAPVCDVHFDYTHDVIGNRSFGSDPKMIMQLSSRFVIGLQDSGVIAVPKHFPGHGRSKHDTHLNQSIVSAELDQLEKVDLVPFSNLKDNLMVMLAHIIYEKIDKEVATYSELIIKKILREKLNFKGLVISDDISMKALQDDIVDIVKKSYNGGCDVVLYCSGVLDEIKKIYPFVKRIDSELFKYFNKKCDNIITKEKDIGRFRNDLAKHEIIKFR